MALRFTHDAITGDRSRHTARRAPGHDDAWHVSWLPGRPLTRTSAVTAMALAEANGTRTPQPGDRYWPHIQGWAAELGLTAPEALTRIAQPPGRASAEKRDATQADPEAAGS
jgi:hypothetical protein